MQLSIQNAQNYDLPATPKIDGREVREAGSPSQSSQVTIINGRRSASFVQLQQLELSELAARWSKCSAVGSSIAGGDAGQRRDPEQQQ